MRFMVSMQVMIPPERAAEAVALLSAEGARVAEHMRQGILEALYVDALERHEYLWAVMRADSLEEAQHLVDGYPMRAFFRPTYTELSEQ